MPDKRKHRGPHPEDRQLFSPQQLNGLQSATRDLNWLLSRGYAVNSSLKLVGDRYQLNVRQRKAVGRCACGDDARARRRRHEQAQADLLNQVLWIDGFNLVTTIEAALSGGAILKGSDGAFRDLASMHGSYKRVVETEQAILITGEVITSLQPHSCRWWFDQPVSNSGRLKKMVCELAQAHRWSWDAELVPDPDPVLKKCSNVVVSADSEILDHADRWFNLARLVIEQHVPDAWMIDLGEQALG